MLHSNLHNLGTQVCSQIISPVEQSCVIENSFKDILVLNDLMKFIANNSVKPIWLWPMELEVVHCECLLENEKILLKIAIAN